MACDTGLRRLQRPSFLIGVIIGIGISSFLCEIFLTLQYDSSSANNIQGRSKREVPRQEDPVDQLNLGAAATGMLDNYEVHNLGLKLRAANKDYGDDVMTNNIFNNNFDPSSQSAVDHFDLVSEDEYIQDRKMLRELKAKKLLYVAVLSDEERVADYATAVHLTWAAQWPAVQFYFTSSHPKGKRRVKRENLPPTILVEDVGSEETYGIQHSLHTLKHVCDNYLEDFHWFVLIKDTTYIQPSALLRMLDRLSPSSYVILGKPIPGNEDYCSVKAGLIISNKLLSQVCPSLLQCESHADSESSDVDLGMCLVKLTGAPCVDSSKLSPQFHVFSDNAKRDTTNLMKSPIESAAFIGPVKVTEDIYQLHLHYTNLKIQKTQEEIFRLGKELSRTKLSMYPKGENESTNDEDNDLTFGSGKLTTNGSAPFYQFIDESGHMYLDTCKVKKDDVNGQGSAYEMALELALDKIGPKAKNMESFAYRIAKPNVGIEYQFYFLESPHRMSGKRPEGDKVYQVTVVQPYGRLEVISKQTNPVQVVYIAVPVPKSLIEFKHFLNNFRKTCLINAPTPRCAVLFLLYRHSKATYSMGQETLQDEIDNLLQEYPQAQIQMMVVSGETYTLARTMQMVASGFPSNSLVAVMPPDVVFSEDFLYRCQLNTIYTRQVYFPIPFQHYDETFLPEKGFSDQQEKISDQYGYWANSDYDIFCAYNEDLQGFDSLPQSALNLYEIFQSSHTSDTFRIAEKIEVFRVPDPALIRKWSKGVCEEGNIVDRHTCMKELKYLNLQ